MIFPFAFTIAVIVGSIITDVYAIGGGVDDDDDDDDDEDLGFGSALSNAFARVKTREIERLLKTAWCVVKGPSCSSRVRRGFHTTGFTGSESTHEVNIEAAINRFSQCICQASELGDECKLHISMSLDHNDHIDVHSSFSLVFYWRELVKDFYCYVSIDSLITCDFSQNLTVPTSSRTEIQNFVQHIRREITHNSECSEFCSRFRCIYESWNDHGLTTPFNDIYERCVKMMCMTTPSPSTTKMAFATHKPSAQVRNSHVTQKAPYANHTMLIPGGEFKADAAEQDGADLGSRDTSTLVGGLVGGLLALLLLAFVMVVILFWRRTRKHNETREVPQVTFISPGQTRIEDDTFRQHNGHVHTNITAINPLAASCLKSRNSQSDVKLLTSHKRGSLEDTYATLTESQMSGPHDNPAYELDMSTNKGEELVLTQGASQNQNYVLEGIYAQPAEGSGLGGNRGQSCEDQYLEPIPEGERYVSFPQQYMEPISANGNVDDYLEPVPVENGYAASGHSYMRMESALSSKSTISETISEDTQYERIDSPGADYYNL